MDTLVLSYSYMPLTRVPWYRAFNMVFTGRAEIIEEYADRVINSFSDSWPMPSIIRFVRKTARYFRKNIRFNRRNVWLRDSGKCQYCGTHVSTKEFTFDHVVPLSKGGRTIWDNIVVACPACNQRKRNRTPREAHMKLLKKPVCPKSLPTVSLIQMWGKGNVPESWKEYLGSARYWNVPFA